VSETKKPAWYGICPYKTQKTKTSVEEGERKMNESRSGIKKEN
jgi:hypothetical protein